MIFGKNYNKCIKIFKIFPILFNKQINKKKFLHCIILTCHVKRLVNEEADNLKSIS